MRTRASWQRLGLTADEWRECQLAAVEMSLARGADVTPQQVALEFALARGLDERALEAQPMLGRPASLPEMARR